MQNDVVNNNNESIDSQDEVPADTSLDSNPTKRANPVVGGVVKILLIGLLFIGLSTAAVAYTVPSVLEPIANALPDSLFPQTPMPAGTSFGADC